MPKSLVFITLLACLFLSVVGGAFVTYLEMFPRILKSSDSAGSAVPQDSLSGALSLLGRNHPALVSSMQKPEFDTAEGVLRYDETRTWDGYTLIATAANNSSILLIDMDGETKYQWPVPEELLQSADPGFGAGELASLSPPTIDAQLVDNGDLLLAVNTMAASTNGGGIGRIDRMGHLLWLYQGPVRENFTITQNGSIYALLRVEHTQPWRGLEHIPTPFYDDELLVLDSSGAELQRVSVLEAMQNSPFLYLLQYADPARNGGELLHTSSVSVLNAQQAALLPGAAENDVLLSLRQLDVIAIMDPLTRVIKWAARGSWHLQSDAYVLDNGNILVFDSNGDLANGGTSRVLEIDPVTLAITWEFPADTGESLLGSDSSGVQRLPNGNTLVADAGGARILEVTSAGNIVWEYRLPQTDSVKPGRGRSRVASARRYSIDAPGFLVNSSEMSP